VVLHALALVVGIVALAGGAELFVTGAAGLARRLGVTPLVVGVLVIGIGTSLPELITGVIASAQGSLGVAIGSAIGSNTVNATLVAGLAGLLGAPRIPSSVLRREAPLAFGAVVVFALACQVPLGRPLAVGLLVLLAAALGLVALGPLHVASRPRVAEGEGPGAPGSPDRPQAGGEEAGRGCLGAGPDGAGPDGAGPDGGAAAQPALDAPPPATTPAARAGTSLGRLSARTAIGLVGTVVGAEALVSGALGIATGLGITAAVVGLTVVGLGTSLPEAVTAIRAAPRGEADLVIGNVLGANLFTSLAVPAVAALVRPGTVPEAVARLPVAGMVLAMLVVVATIATGHRLRRAEGVLLLGLYVAYLVASVR
jgi:cation:H+ antiporter